MSNLNENGISVFSNTEFGNIRVEVIDGEPWFVGKDVAIALGYKDPKAALRDKLELDEEVKRLLIDSMGRTQEAIFINESGLYSLIFGSKLDSSKRFKKWVTSEVLPSIRKTGGYNLVKPSYLIEDQVRRAEAWIEEQKQRIELERKNEELIEDNSKLLVDNYKSQKKFQI